MARSAAEGKQRREELVELLTASHSVSTTDLAAHFKVSEMTIRRDLKQLHEAGVAVPCYGGAMAARRISFEFDFDERHRQNLLEKQRIGQAAATQAKSGQILFLDTGTTTLELAKSLAKKNCELSVITASLVVANELWGRENINLQILGGEVRRGNPDLAGPLTEIVLERLTADIAFLGSDGIDPDRGGYAVDAETARIAERMADGAEQVVVVSDSSKLGRVSKVRYIKTSDIDKLITDVGADATVVDRLREQGVEVQLV